ncbi:MAG: hypothetical protein ABGZ35_00020 [Planctomycetaceae bacterium]
MRISRVVVCALQCVPVTVCCAADTSPDVERSAAPAWIWKAEDRISKERVELQTRFSVKHAVHEVRLKCAADFCSVNLAVDGITRLSIDHYAPLVDRRLDMRLEPGDHTLTLDCRGHAGPSAVALSLELTGPDGSTRITTSETWPNVVSIANVAPEYWGIGARRAQINVFDDYEQWKDAIAEDAANVLPDFSAPAGFEINRVCSATSDQGSWVSLAIDDRGRFIIAREDQGLLRMTPASDGHSIASVETINSELKECRGLAFHDGSLFVNANNSKALYVLRSTTDDDRFDEQTLLRSFSGSVGHGRNDLAVGAAGLLYSIHGDSVTLPTTNVLDRTSPFRAARRGQESHEGALLRASPDGKRWELVCAGLRNPFGVALHPEHGEAFTYDADAEFDMGAPWYRPTRVLHLTSGSDYGWRGVTGQWPPYFPDRTDNSVAVCDIGKASPTAVKFGTDSNFPPHYQRALFILDWAYGRIVAVHLVAHGAGYRAQPELFVRGRPLNVTDLDFGPDGAMYVVTGGRKTQSSLYRIRYAGSQISIPALTAQQRARADWSKTARNVRRELETFHEPNPTAIETAWKFLGHLDPTIRHAARVAIEHQPVASWRDRALTERESLTAFTALLMLARSGDTEMFPAMLRRLNECDPARHGETSLVTALRAYSLCLHKPDDIEANVRAESRTRLSSIFPQPTHETITPLGWIPSANHGLSQLLTSLDAESATGKVVRLMEGTNDQHERLYYLYILRTVRLGWTPPLRRAWFTALNDAAGVPGGRGLPGFLDSIRSDALTTLSESERRDLADLLNPAAIVVDEPLPQRPFVQEWTAADLTNSLSEVSSGRNFENGKEMFRAALCNRCHRSGADGSAVGPDLTSVGRRFSSRVVLQSILEPSAVIAEPYRAVNLVTTDGRMFNGQVIASGDYRARNVRIIPDPLRPSMIVEIPKQEIAEHLVSKTSPMPKGLLNTLTRTDVLDLLAYLVVAGDRRHPAFAPSVQGTKP